MLNRLILNGDPVPARLVDYARAPVAATVGPDLGHAGAPDGGAGQRTGAREPGVADAASSAAAASSPASTRCARSTRRPGSAPSGSSWPPSTCTAAASSALSPLLVISSARRDGRLDASPRGGDAGFVKVPDEQTLLIPDSPGNNRLDTLEQHRRNRPRRPAVPGPGRRRDLADQRHRQLRDDPELLELARERAPPAEAGDPDRRRGGLPALRQGADALAAVGAGVAGRSDRCCRRWAG